MKISELNTKSFLGGTGAAENSYVLINYEDNSTSEPITYKASLQELGKAIANDQKLYKKTQNGAITTNVSQGTYVNTAAENFASTGAVTAAVSGLASTGYVTNAISTATNDLLDINDVRSLFINDSIATTVDVDRAVNGLASTGYVDEAVANASFSGFDPTKSIACSIASSVNGQQIIDTQALFPIMILNNSCPTLYAQSSTGGNYMDELGGLITATDFNGLDEIAYIGTSDAKPCIRNKYNIFQGFLSTT